MKRVLVISGAILIFCFGFIIGRHSEITQIIAQELGSSTPTGTITPTPTIIQQTTLFPTLSQPIQTALPTAGGGPASPNPELVEGEGGPRNDIVETGHIVTPCWVGKFIVCLNP